MSEDVILDGIRSGIAKFMEKSFRVDDSAVSVYELLMGGRSVRDVMLLTGLSKRDVMSSFYEVQAGMGVEVVGLREARKRCLAVK